MRGWIRNPRPSSTTDPISARRSRPPSRRETSRAPDSMRWCGGSCDRCAQGLVEHPVAEHPAAIDFAAHAAIAQSAAEEGAVLLKNDGNLLPLSAGAARTIAVIGSYADAGVLSGGGSSQVFPRGGMAVKGLGPQKFPGPIVYFPDSPLDAMRVRLRRVRIMYDDGEEVEAAAKLAR